MGATTLQLFLGTTALVLGRARPLDRPGSFQLLKQITIWLRVMAMEGMVVGPVSLFRGRILVVFSLCGMSEKGSCFFALHENRSEVVTILSLFCFFFLVLKVRIKLEGTFGRRI